ncbi:MAG: choice-of-anchor V domain-containing protein [Acidiferrobacterales bacterium]
MNYEVKNFATAGIFLLGLVVSQNVFSSSGGISGYSGNPATNAGNTCSACHSGGTAPTVNLTGPATVQPGTINTFTFTISGGQQNSGGLDISADGGTLINTLASTRLQNGEIIHNQRATVAGDGTVSWNFDWQAPAISGSYTIYSAGLSTNGDNNTTLDAVSTNAYVVSVSSAAPQPPTAVILAPMTAQLNATVSFDGSASFDPDGTINLYGWNFSDGSTATGAQTTKTFTTTGTYTATLVVTDSDSLTNSTFRDITVGGVMVPVANPGGPYTGTGGQAVSFDASQSTHVDPIKKYIWDFGDGTAVVQGVVPAISHTYNQPGAYTVTLAVQDANVITGVASTTVVIDAVTPPPVTGGPALYANNCAVCHGPLETSSKLNRTASQIQVAIDAGTGGMGSLSGLTPTEIQSIADALASVTPPPVTGQELYDVYCLACHGPGGKGGLYEDVTGESASDIDKAIGKEPLMNSISLTPDQIQRIADYLSGK